MQTSDGEMLVISLEDLSSYDTLYKVVSEKQYDKYDALMICRNICRAVAELHAMGIIHGDLSSENILVKGGSFEVKLIDFDLSKMVGTRAKAMGNPDFVCEEVEQATHSKKSIKSSYHHDLYSLALCCLLVISLEER
jgi:serine/threonine protein kinase